MADSRKKGQRGVMVVVVVIVLFCPVAFQENIAWLGGIAGILGDVGPFPHSNPTPLVALIYGIGRCARESLVLLDAEVRKGFCPFRPCLVGWDDGWWTRPMDVEYD